MMTVIVFARAHHFMALIPAIPAKYFNDCLSGADECYQKIFSYTFSAGIAP